MKKLNMVDVSTKSAIASLLETVHKKDIGLQIWQNNDGIKVKAAGKLVKFKKGITSLTIKSNDKSLQKRFELKEIYFFCPYRTMIFKSNLLEIKNKELKLSFPELVKIDEARSEKRHNLGLRSYQHIIAQFIPKDQDEIFHPSKLKVLDYSENGCGFLISTMFGKLLSEGDEFNILKSTIEEQLGRVGEIRNFTSFTNNLTGEKFIRIGARLSPVDTIVEK